MKRTLLVLLVMVAACTSQPRGADPDGAAAASWFEWHDKKMETDNAVLEAINRPIPDYVEAIAITRASDRPSDVKRYDVANLILDAYDEPRARRPAETNDQGLAMMEEVALGGGECRAYAPQQLRLIFERGTGLAPNRIAPDAALAACWRRVEDAPATDPRPCIALRRQRRP